MQDEQYFIRRRGRVTGPYDFDTVRKMVQTGKLYKSDELSLDQVDWVTASETEFFPEKKKKPVEPIHTEQEDNYDNPSPSATPIYSPPPPQMLWYYALNDQQLGPIKESELKQQFQLKTIGAKTKVWCEGMSTWEDADKNHVFREYFIESPMVVPQGGTGTGYDRYCENCGNRVEPRAFMCMRCGSRLKKGIETQEGGHQNSDLLEYSELATIGQRFIAHTIDGFILGFIAILEACVLSIPAVIITFAGNEAAATLSYMISLALVCVVYFATFIYYEAYLISTEKMATPGKAMFNLAVCREDGSRLTLGLAIGRLFVKTFLSPILLIGYLLAIFNNKHQALHDMMAGSIVVQQK